MAEETFKSGDRIKYTAQAVEYGGVRWGARKARRRGRYLHAAKSRKYKSWCSWVIWDENLHPIMISNESFEHAEEESK